MIKKYLHLQHDKEVSTHSTISLLRVDKRIVFVSSLLLNRFTLTLFCFMLRFAESAVIYLLTFDLKDVFLLTCRKIVASIFVLLTTKEKIELVIYSGIGRCWESPVHIIVLLVRSVDS